MLKNNKAFLLCVCAFDFYLNNTTTDIEFLLRPDCSTIGFFFIHLPLQLKSVF